MKNLILSFLSKYFDCIDYRITGEYWDQVAPGRYRLKYIKKYYIKKRRK